MAEPTVGGTDRWRNDHAGPVAPRYSYADLLRRRGSLLSFVQPGGGSASAAAEGGGSAPAAAAEAAVGSAGAAESTVGSSEEGEKVSEFELKMMSFALTMMNSVLKLNEFRKVETLRAILGAEVSDPAARALLERCGWDVQRAVAGHFNDGAGDVAAAAAAAAAGVGGGGGGAAGGGGGEGGRATAERGVKRSATSAGGHQKSEQRSVLSMWGRQA